MTAHSRAQPITAPEIPDAVPFRLSVFNTVEDLEFTVNDLRHSTSAIPARRATFFVLVPSCERNPSQWPYDSSQLSAVCGYGANSTIQVANAIYKQVP